MRSLLGILTIAFGIAQGPTSWAGPTPFKAPHLYTSTSWFGFDLPPSPYPYQYQPTLLWYCAARAPTLHGPSRIFVSGGHTTQQKAKEVALQLCQDAGYSDCRAECWSR